MSGIPSKEEVQQAIIGGDVRQVKQWVHSGVLDVNRKLWCGVGNALHYAAWCHQVEMIEAMIQAGWDVDIQTDSVGTTALHCVMSGMYDGRYDRAKSAVFTLLNAGCNPNICDNGGRTALHWVVYVSNRDYSQEKIQVIMEVIQMLIDAGVDITIKNKDGKTALDMSEREAVSTLLKKKLAEVAQASGQSRQQLKKQAAMATQAYIMSLPDPLDSDKVLLELTKERFNREPDIELVQARASSQFDDTLAVPMEVTDVYSMVGQRSDFGRQRNLDPTEYAHFYISLGPSLLSVGYLRWSNGFQGSAFRVGDKYIMTNYHVVKEMDSASDEEETNRGENRYVSFDMNRPDERRVYPLQWHTFVKNPLKWFNPELDIAILELSTRTVLPCPVRFAKLDGHQLLYFSGHPSGDAKHVNDKCKIVSQYEDLERWSMEKYKANYYEGAGDPQRVLYHLSKEFKSGSSGSPGFIVHQNKDACVAAIHTFAFPDIPPNVAAPPLDKTVEQGVRVEFVYDKLLQDDPELCRNVFPGGRPK